MVNERTGVSLGFVVSILGVLAITVGPAAWWTVQALEDLRLGQREAAAEIRQIHRECLSRDQFNSWASVFQEKNPSLRVPWLTEKGGSMPVEAKTAAEPR